MVVRFQRVIFVLESLVRINLLCIAAKKFVFGKHYREGFKPSLKLVIEF